MKNEGSQLYEDIVQLKMKSSDGKFYKTDVATIKQLLHIIQSVPSPIAEPFKQGLAQIGIERLNEVDNPELAMQRAVETYHKKGYSEEWIEQRLQSIMVRKDLTAEWNSFSVELEVEYAILTDEITKA